MIHDIPTALAQQVRLHRERLDAARKVLSWFTTIQKLLDKADIEALYVCLQSGAPKGVELDDAAHGVLRDLMEVVSEKFTELRVSFAHELQKRAASESIPLVGDYPRFQAFDVIPVNVDDRKGKVQVGGHDCGLNPTRVMELIREEQGRLFSHQFAEDSILEHVWQAYNRVLHARGVEMGQTVSLREVHKEMLWLRQSDRFFRSPNAKTLATYDDAQFSTDLYRLQRTSLSFRGWKLRLHPVRDSKDAYLVYAADGSGNFRGLMSFQREALDHGSPT